MKFVYLLSLVALTVVVAAFVSPPAFFYVILAWCVVLISTLTYQFPAGGAVVIILVAMASFEVVGNLAWYFNYWVTSIPSAFLLLILLFTQWAIEDHQNQEPKLGEN